MLNSIKQWFTPSVFEGDEEKTRLASLLHVMTTAMLLFIITLIAIKLFNGKGLEPVTILDCIGCLYLLPIYHWLRRGKVTLAGIWFASLLFVIITLVNVSQGTITTFTTASYVLVVFLAGMLFYWRGILGATIACSLAVLGVMLAGNAGVLPLPDYTVRFGHWVAYTGLFGISGGMSFFALDGTLKALARVKREVTERERVEMELRTLTRAVEQSPASIVITDLNGNIEYVNPRFTQVTGYTPDEAIGKNPRILRTGKTPPETYHQLWETLAAGKEWRGEFVNRKKDGSLYHESAIISPVTDQNGVATHYLAVKEDISERKRAEEALQKNQALLNSTGRMAHVGGWEINLATQALTWTEEVYRIHEVEADYEPKLNAAIEFYAPESRPVIEQAVQQAVEQGLPFDMQLQIITARGNRRWVHAIGQAEQKEGKAARVFGTFQDITERKMAEEALRESEERLKLAARAGRIGVWDWDVVNKHMIWADDVYDLYGIVKGDFDGSYEAWLQTLHPDDREAIDAEIEAALNGEREYAPEFRIISGDGSIKFIQAASQTIYDANGNATRMIGINIDITERKLAEEALRKSEQKFAAFMDHLPGYAYIQDAQRRYIYVNQALEEFLGNGKGGWRDKSIEHLLPDSDIDRIQTFDESVLAYESPHTGEETIVKDGQAHTYLSNKFPITQPDGSVVLGGISIDITDRRKAEEALRKTEEKYRDLFAQSPEDIYIVTTDGKILDFNQEMTVVGNPRDEIIGKNILNLSGFKDNLEQAKPQFTRVMGGDTEPFEYPLKSRTGETIWIEIHPAIVDDGANKFLRLTAINITARKQAEEKLRASESNLKNILQAMTEGVVMIDLTGQIAFANRTSENILGISRDEVAQKYYSSREWHQSYADGSPIPPEKLPLSVALTEKRFVKDFEHVITALNGEKKWISVNAAPLFDEKNEIYGAIAGFQDITERKQAEEALRKSEQRLKLAVRTGSIGIWEWDIVNDRRIWEDNMYALYGIREEGFASVYDAWLETLHPDDRNYVNAEIQAALRGEREYAPEFRIIRGDGEVRVMKAASQTIYDENGKALRMVGINMDITEIKRSEEKLRQLSRAVEFSPTAITIVGMQGDIQYANPKFTELTGYTLEEAIGKGFNIIATEHTPLETRTQMQAAVIAGSDWSGELCNRRKNGELYWERTFMSPIKNEKGEITHYVGVSEDITERKRLESSLQESEYFARSTLDALSAHIAILDENGKILAVNRAWREFGRDNSAGDFNLIYEGTNYLSVCDVPSGVNGEEAPAIAAGIRAVMDNKQKDFSLEYPCHSPTEKRWFNARVTRFPGKGDLRVVIAHENITERVLAEEELRKNEALLNLILNTAPQTIFWKDLQGRYLGVNQTFLKITGLESAQVIGKTDFDLPFSREDAEAYTAADNEVIETNSPKLHMVGQLQQIDGSQRWIDTSKAPLHDVNGQPFAVLGITEDITERKESEEALLLAHDQAVKANQLKSQLIAKVSHELRTPLSSVLGFAELLKYNIFGGELNAEQMEAADQIIDSAHYLTDMVNEFLDEAEIESRSLMLDHKPFVVVDVLKHVETTMSIIANKKGLALKTYLAPDLPESLWGDARRLQQILINLTNNAIKFTRAGEVNINMLRHSEYQWAIEVKDTGVGIPKDAQEIIFEPFKQMDNAITRENQGTGLGLTITKQLIGLMSGRVLVESEVGKGSTFTVILPMQNADKP